MLRTIKFLMSSIFLSSASIVLAAADGFPDVTFGVNGLQISAFDLGSTNNDQANGLAVLPDGKIVLAGSVRKSPGLTGIGLTRLREDGQPDMLFGKQWYLPQGLVEALIYDLVIQPDGKMVVVGHGTASMESKKALICRFLADSPPDNGFASAQPNPLSGTGCRLIGNIDQAVSISSVLLQPNGRIVMAGTLNDSNAIDRGLVVRLDAQGNLDSTFDDDGIHVLLPQSSHEASIEDIAITPSGDFIAVGQRKTNGINPDWQIFRLRGEDGSLDTNFDSDGVVHISLDFIVNGVDTAAAVSVLPNGDLLVGGTAERMEGFCPVLVRLMPDGKLDGTLDDDGIFSALNVCSPNLSINDMLVQSDERVVLAGSMYENFFATRVLPEGGLDASFGFFNISWLDFADLYNLQVSYDAGRRIASHAGRLLLVGLANAEINPDFAIARLANDLIFSDDLE